MGHGEPNTSHGGKARGAGADRRKYSLWEWTKGYTALVLTFPLYAFLWFLATFVRRLPAGMVAKLLRVHNRITRTRPYDVRIPGNKSMMVYMLRWWYWARNAFLNCYIHQVYRSDDDTAHHDHPWWSFSLVLENGYWEVSILAGGIHKRVWRGPGEMVFRWHGAKAHRLELHSIRWTGIVPHELDGFLLHECDNIRIKDDGTFEVPSKSIFITGPVLRRWGFHHKNGWVDAYDWDDYCRDQGLASTMDGYAEQQVKG